MAPAVKQTIQLTGRRYFSTLATLLIHTVTMGISFILTRNFIYATIFFKTYSSELSDADCVVLSDSYGNMRLFPIRKIATKPSLNLKRYIRNGKVHTIDTPYGRFIYDFQQNRFILPQYPQSSAKSFTEIYQQRLLRSKEEETQEIHEKKILFGANSHRVEVSTVSQIILDSVCDLFFLWEVVSIVLWVCVGYIRYSLVMGLIFFYIFFKSVLTEIRQVKEMRKLNRVGNLRMFRSRHFIEISETEVVPGDLIYIDKTECFACDIQLLKGNVIADESFITGETVPVCKGPGSQVYSGTKIVRSTGKSVSVEQIRCEKFVKVKSLFKTESQKGQEAPQNSARFDDTAIGVVLKTGVRTKRGQLLKNLFFKKPVVNRFKSQSLNITIYLFILALIISIFLGFYLNSYLTFKKNLEFTADIFLIFFSPVIHSSIELGVEHARRELKKNSVVVSEAPRINTAGEVDLVIFDKTGTLTEEDVEILCIDTLNREIKRSENLVNSKEPEDMLRRLALSTCHSVIELDSQYSGDSLDMKLFLFSDSKIFSCDGKRYIEVGFSGPEDERVEVLRIHDFDPGLKRMSVAVKTPDGKSYLFCKGAPDSLRTIFKDVPTTYRERVNSYSLQGRRVIALGYKVIPYGQPVTRASDESNLKFLGLTVFTNRLKDETKSVIVELQSAKIGSKMCTGDGVLTAISVARDCGMMGRNVPVLFPVVEERNMMSQDVEWLCVADEEYIFDKIKMLLYSESDQSTPVEFVIACEGREFEYFRKMQEHAMILERGVVFARFNPENKKQLVEDYSSLGFTVLYCGDGANDMGALSVSDVGLSLSSNGAGFASSFSASSLTAVTTLIKEGRSALAMSSAQFRFSLFTQLFSGLHLSAFLLFLVFPSDMMSLSIDFVNVYPLSFAISNFKAASVIGPNKPAVNLKDGFISIGAEVAVIFIIHITGCFLIGFPVRGDRVETKSKHGTILFFSMFFIQVYRAVLFSNFKSFRGPRIKNRVFISVIFGCVFFGILLLSCFLLKVPKVMEWYEFVSLEGVREYVVCAGCVGLPLFISCLFG